MQKKSKHISNYQALQKSLSILLSSDGFSFCIADAVTLQIVSFTKYVFANTVDTPQLLLGKVLHIFGSDKDLQHDFKNISVIHQNYLSTLVPNDFFDENNLKIYLNYNIKTLANDYITFDDIDAIHTKNVYIPFVNINNYLFQNFGEFEFKHHSTVLIDKILAYAKNNINSNFFVNVTKNQLDIVVVQKEDLIFYNSFSYYTKEDFIYYILFVAEQLAMNPNDFKLTFLGAIELDDDIYKITYKYVRTVEFIKVTSHFFNTSEEFSNHSNYLLIS